MPRVKGLKGQGHRDLIWLKVVSLDRFWLVGPTHQDLSNDTTFRQIKSRVPVPLRCMQTRYFQPVKGNHK